MHQTRIGRPALEHLSPVGHPASGPEWREIRRFIDLAARCSVNVLISGGSRRVRETLARLIHQEGARRGEPFVVVDFERASDLREDLASLGSLFLEELHGLSPSSQADLLGILDQRSWPPGSRRVIAGASIDLFDRVGSGTFSGNLFYRLNMLHLVI